MAAIDPDRVAQASFGTARRGFDPHEVRAYLGRVAAELRRLGAEADRPRPPTPVDELSDAELGARLGEEATLVLQAARDTAAGVRQRAEDRARELAGDAAGEATRTVAAAEEEAGRLRRAAGDEIEAARDRARDLTRAAREQRDATLAELDGHHRRAVGRLGELTSVCDQLEEGLRQLTQHTAAAEQALRRARIAAAEAAQAAQAAEAAESSGPPGRGAEEPEAEDRDAAPPPAAPPAAGHPGAEAVTPPAAAAPAGPSTPPPPVRRRLLGDDDLPVAVPEGGPLAPRAGQYDPAPPPPPVVGAEDRPRPEVVQDLFAELRAARSTPDAPAVDQPGLFTRRDELATESGASTVRLVKRALADAENGVLAAVEGGDPPTLGDLLAGWPALLGPPLREAAVAARALAGGSPSDGEPVLDDLVVAVPADAEDRLGARLGALGADADRRRVRAAFREWRSERLAPCVDGVVAGAIARGVAATAAGDDPVAWRCHPDGGCPDGEDNQLAGTVALGDRFPTGHVLPPGCEGCRCLVVPAGH